MMEKGIKEDFIKEECRDLYKVFDNIDEMLDYIENYKAVDMDILNLKNI